MTRIVTTSDSIWTDCCVAIFVHARAYTKGRQWGWISANDVRKFENLAPIEGGDAYFKPMNMVEVGRPQNDEEDAVE